MRYFNIRWSLPFPHLFFQKKKSVFTCLTISIITAPLTQGLLIIQHFHLNRRRFTLEQHQIVCARKAQQNGEKSPLEEKLLLKTSPVHYVWYHHQPSPSGHTSQFSCNFPAKEGCCNYSTIKIQPGTRRLSNLPEVITKTV